MVSKEDGQEELIAAQAEVDKVRALIFAEKYSKKNSYEARIIGGRFANSST
jgi:hypothetical protein